MIICDSHTKGIMVIHGEEEECPLCLLVAENEKLNRELERLEEAIYLRPGRAG
jgi:hypothetical protein